MDTVAIKKLLEGLNVTDQEAQELYGIITAFASTAIDTIFEEIINGTGQRKAITDK